MSNHARRVRPRGWRSNPCTGCRARTAKHTPTYNGQPIGEHYCCACADVFNGGLLTQEKIDSEAFAAWLALHTEECGPPEERNL